MNLGQRIGLEDDARLRKIGRQLIHVGLRFLAVRALEIADRRIIVVDQTMRAMRDAVRLAKLFGEDAPTEHHTLFVVNRVGEFGFALGFSVLVDALIIRGLLVPALMHLIGPANWALPTWLQRTLPRLALETKGDLLGSQEDRGIAVG